VRRELSSRDIQLEDVDRSSSGVIAHESQSALHSQRSSQKSSARSITKEDEIVGTSDKTKQTKSETSKTVIHAKDSHAQVSLQSESVS
jgi:hypothetical protein